MKGDERKRKESGRYGLINLIFLDKKKKLSKNFTLFIARKKVVSSSQTKCN